MESNKTYHFEYEDGSRTEDRKLNSYIWSIMGGKGDRPMKAILHFSEECELSENEKRNVNLIIHALHPMGGRLEYGEYKSREEINI